MTRMPPRTLAHSVDAHAHSFDSKVSLAPKESVGLVVASAGAGAPLKPVNSIFARNFLARYMESHPEELDALGRPD